jgi:pyrimidine deaminase RibD-like protein
MDSKSDRDAREEIPYVTDPWHVQFMTLATQIAQKSPYTDERYRIGCVIVVDNIVVGTGYTCEDGPYTTAIECAFKKIEIKPPPYFFFYNVYVTMEPAGVRLDNRVPEAEIIVKAGCKNVFLGTCEPHLYLDEKGYATLIRNDVEISIVDHREPLLMGDIRRASLAPNKHLVVDGRDIINRILRR